jgi:hypothetical protein
MTQHGFVPRLLAINQLSINLTDIQYPLCTNGGNGIIFDECGHS